jgi:hypothetical protein
MLVETTSAASSDPKPNPANPAGFLAGSVGMISAISSICFGVGVMLLL